MNFLDTFETAVLFRFARLLTLILVAAGLLMALFGAVLYNPLLMQDSLGVTATEVRSELTANPKAQAPVQSPSSTEGIAVSIETELDRFALVFDPNQYDRDQLRAEAISWVKQLQDPTIGAQFLRDMTKVVSEFPQKERGGAAYAFVRLRFRKEAEASLNAQRIATSREQGRTLVFLGIGTVGIFSLILVLLRIERNTRR